MDRFICPIIRGLKCRLRRNQPYANLNKLAKQALFDAQKRALKLRKDIMTPADIIKGDDDCIHEYNNT